MKKDFDFHLLMGFDGVDWTVMMKARVRLRPMHESVESYSLYVDSVNDGDDEEMMMLRTFE